ncbi:MAG: hypothetical protein IPM51_01360 [Sphingobacteriaceae bacterium]|nr:hypothetical protein [Sphingobacteriaceae bacterium]
MNVFINDDQKISDLQSDFSKIFPFLKIEFFSQMHKKGGGSAKKLMLPAHLTIGESRTIHKSGVLNITPQMSVSVLEGNFRDMYGLGVQVFRKSGSIWLETTVTDDWTLEDQNKQGEALSK